MSRIGKQPIEIPKEVTVTVAGQTITVAGPKGTLVYELPRNGVDVSLSGSTMTVTCLRNDKKAKSLFGFVRAHVANMITGVAKGWTKSLELSGVGFRAAVTNNNLVLNVGFSHQVTIVPPPDVTFTVAEGKILVSGIDKQVVGQVASNIRIVKKPEPYKGKGIRYTGEHIRRKAGKSAKAIGGAPGAAK